MKGFSVFLSEDLTTKEDYFKKMQQAGFQRIFTSLHIPEEDVTEQLTQIKKLGALAQKYRLDVMADTSMHALNQLLGQDIDLAKLKAYGITGLRVDYGFSLTEIAQLSQQIPVGLNASTLTVSELSELEKLGANFSQMEAWHNYYPRPETGLAAEYCLAKNQWLHAHGLKTVAFVAGDKKLRGPLFAGLPTLEKQRYLNPLAAMLDLTQHLAVDEVFIGDPELSDFSIAQFTAYEKQATILLRATAATSLTAYPFLQEPLNNRPDEAEAVLRFSETRAAVTTAIVPEDAVTRPSGSITIDNQAYGRYMGEVQIAKVPLPKDDKVNVLGYVQPADRPLLAFVLGNQQIQLQWQKGEEDGFNQINDRNT